MKRKLFYRFFFTGTALLLCQVGVAQNPQFVQDDKIKIAGITTDAQIELLTPAQKTTTILYYDGLNRPLQSITEQASPLGHDMIQPAAYDNLGRQTFGYLPYTDESANITGSYRPNAISTDQPAFYDQTTQYLIPVDGAPYAQHVFENSPMQRLLQAGVVGTGFQPGGGHVKTVNYRPNSAADGNILVWATGAYITGTYYADNSLSVTDGKDEDNTETLTFTDLEGHLILKRQILTSGNLDTYYIYNNAGMISYIVPPKAMALMVANNNYSLSQTGVNALIFIFIYDTMGRLTQKIVPAKGVTYIVYDPLNRPVLQQDANMRVNNQWNYIKYDVKGRAISQGIYTDATHTSLALMQNFVNTGVSYTIWYEQRTSAGTTGYYTNSVFPTTGITPLAYAYFDDYNMTESGSADFSYVPQGLPGEETATTAAVKGMPTMTTKTTVGAGLTATWLTTVVFYDKRLNAIQSRSNNQLNYTTATTVTDTKTTVPDFVGVPQVSLVKKVTGSTISVQTNFTYDQMDRLSVVSQQYNGGTAMVVAAYNYNEIGEVIRKNLGQLTTATIPTSLNLNNTYSGTNTFVASSSITLSPTSPGFVAPSGATFKAYIGTNYLQGVDYRYNIRGQLLNINNSKLANDGGVTNTDTNDLFGMTFFYDQTGAGLGNHPSYDGKLTGVEWMSKDASGNSGYERAFNYYYDAVNRDTAAIYNERPTASTDAFTTTHGWDENSITYDQNGNLQTIVRMDATQGLGNHVPIDNLTYTYSTSSPNQLSTVTDSTGNPAGFNNITGSSGNYTYDPNGNLTADPYKGITAIGYNYLNRTNKVTITSTQYINYTYDAGGTLIRKQAYKSGTATQITDYIDGFVYNNTSGAETLAYFAMPEGRVINNAGTLVQEFVITDQQGNARVSFQNNGNGYAIVKQENSYYAFGLIMPGSTVNTPPTPNKNLYNSGSEWQNDFGNLPDYYQTFNRNYDAAIARFVGVDPAAEGAESLTSYQYADNDPVMFNDPLGDLANGIVNGVFQQYNASNDFNDWLTGVPGSGAGAAAGGGGSGSGGGGGKDYSGFWVPLIAGVSNGTITNQNYSDYYNSYILGPYAGYNLGFSQNGVLNFKLANSLIGSGIIAQQAGSPNEQEVITQDQLIALLENLPSADDANSGGNSNAGSSWDAINNGISAFGIGLGVKGSMIAAAIHSGEEATTALKTYGKVTDALGVAGGVLAMGTAGYNMYNQYEQNHRVSDIHIGDAGDFAVGATSVIATLALASNPIGWAIGIGAAAYFTGRLIYQETH